MTHVACRAGLWHDAREKPQPAAAAAEIAIKT